jgi:hypothetical protein
MNYELPEQLCINIYNYLETKPCGEAGVMFTMFKQNMEKQNIDKQMKDAKDKMRTEINEESEKSILEATKKDTPEIDVEVTEETKEVKDVLPE